MNKWRKFWNECRIIDINSNKDLLYQVGKTVKGIAISDDQFNRLIRSIENELQLSENDTLLDLCCGNGVITYEIAKKVKSVIGVDFVEAYIENANKLKKSDNTIYIHGDVKILHEIDLASKEKIINKVLLYDGLAYFTPSDLERMLNFLNKVTAPGANIMFGSVLDRDKIFKFYNTIYYKLHYIINRNWLGRDDRRLGRWWTKNEIIDISRKSGFNCKYFDQDPILHTAHYRFDLVLNRN